MISAQQKSFCRHHTDGEDDDDSKIDDLGERITVNTKHDHQIHIYIFRD